MRAHRSVYRGYAIYVSGADASWSFRVELLTPEFPLLARPVSDCHRSWSKALEGARREIDGIRAG